MSIDDRFRQVVDRIILTEKENKKLAARLDATETLVNALQIRLREVERSVRAKAYLDTGAPVKNCAAGTVRP